MSKNKKIILGIGAVAGGLLLVGMGGFLIIFRPLLSVNPAELPKLVTAEAVTLDNIAAVSKFRSGAGHDFSSGGEQCRSMKHYFMPKLFKDFDPTQAPATIDPTANVPVYSPVNGTIAAMEAEQIPLGRQIHIQASLHPAFTIRLFHVYPLPDMQAGMQVKAGQRIGSLLPYQQTDIAVQVMTFTGPQFVSYFDVMDDQVFQAYQARGVSDRKSYVISKAERDAHPLSCNGEQFAQPASDNTGDWVYFSDSPNPQK